MTEKKKKLEMNAVVFRNIFLALFVLLFTTSVVLASFGASQLESVASEVNQVVDEADTLDDTNEQTVTLWDELQSNQEVADKTRQIVADSQKYAYQNVIVRDLKAYATKAGITVTNYDFTIVQGDTAQAASSTANTETGTANPSASANNAVALKTTSVSISVDNTVNYKRLMTFIHYIEQNLTKMQISKISLTRANDDSPGAVNSDAFIIEVYIR